MSTAGSKGANRKPLTERSQRINDATPDGRLELLETLPSTRGKRASRWGSAPYADERSKRSEHDNGLGVGQTDNSFTDTFDDRSSVRQNTRMLFRPFSMDGGSGIVPAVSTITKNCCNSTTNNTRFFPPGVNTLVLTLKTHRNYNTSIQPGSAAARSSRSRMSFANRRWDENAEPTMKNTTIESVGVLPCVPRFCAEVQQKENIDHIFPRMKPKVINSHAVDNECTRLKCVVKPTSMITDATNTTRNPSALSALSFWTPAPNIVVTIAPPVRRRRLRKMREQQ